jgi:hypothetical protein
VKVTCAECQDLLLDLAYGELSPARAAEVEAHVQGCASCQRERAQIAGARTLVAPLLKIEEPSPAMDEPILRAARAEAARLAQGAGQRAAAAAAAPRVIEVVGSISSLEAATSVDAHAPVQINAAPRKRSRWALRVAVAGSIAAAAGLAVVVTDTRKATDARQEAVATKEPERQIHIVVPEQPKKGPAGAPAAPPPPPVIAEKEARLAPKKAPPADKKAAAGDAESRAQAAQLGAALEAELDRAERGARAGRAESAEGKKRLVAHSDDSKAKDLDGARKSDRGFAKGQVGWGVLAKKEAPAPQPPPPAEAKPAAEPSAREETQSAAPGVAAAPLTPQAPPPALAAPAPAQETPFAQPMDALAPPRATAAKPKAAKRAPAATSALSDEAPAQDNALQGLAVGGTANGAGGYRGKLGNVSEPTLAGSASQLEARARTARHAGSYLEAALLYRQAAALLQRSAASGEAPYPSSNQMPADPSSVVRRDLPAQVDQPGKGPVAQDLPDTGAALSAAAWNLAHAVECLAADSRIEEARRVYEELLTTYPRASGPLDTARRALRSALPPPHKAAAPLRSRNKQADQAPDDNASGKESNTSY